MGSTRDPAAEAARSFSRALFRALRAHFRLALCGALGAAVGLVVPETLGGMTDLIDLLQWVVRNVTRILIGWNAAVSFYLCWAAMRIYRSTHDDIRLHAQDADEGRSVVLGFSVIAAFVSIGAIVLELGQVKGLYESEKSTHILLAMFTVVASWTFMHLIFAFHYAHEYYFEQETETRRKRELRGGLLFPGEHAPQYRDFLYYAFVIGVASQTADISTTSPTMRKVTLLHGVLAFFYNATIVALAVNIASDIV